MERNLRPRTTVSNYQESDVEEEMDYGIPVSTTSSEVVNSVIMSSSMAGPLSSTLITSTSVTMTTDFVMSPLSTLSVTDLQRQVQQAREEFQKKQLSAELRRLREATANIDLPDLASSDVLHVAVDPLVSTSRALLDPPSLTAVPREPTLDLPTLRTDPTLVKSASAKIKKLGLADTRRRRERSSSTSSSSSSASTFSDTSSSSSEDRKSKKKKKKTHSKKKKSGKFLKPSSKVKVEQDWPQAFLSLKYVTKAKRYEALSQSEFVAGYASILEQPKLPSSERQARIAHLRQLMYLATTHRWSSVLEFHATVLHEIERGHLQWTDSFDSIMAQFLASYASQGQPSLHRNTSLSGVRSGAPPTYFCRAFNYGVCSKTAPHSDIVNNKSVTVQHICAKCYMTNRTSQFHSESSPACPSGVSTSSNPTTIPATSG